LSQCDDDQCISISGQCVSDPFFTTSPNPSPRLQLLGNSLVDVVQTTLPVVSTTFFYEYNDNSLKLEWKYFNDKWFFYNFIVLTHDYAEKVCNENGATLAIVTDEDILTFLVDEVMDLNQNAFVSS
jgi:hypothetical protein